MAGNTIYIPLSEETFSFIKRLKSREQDIDTFLKDLLSEKIYQKDVELMQTEKMKELWDNKSDEIWNKL